jgi:hypothetical protein
MRICRSRVVVVLLVLLALSVCLPSARGVGDAHTTAPHACSLMAVASAPATSLIAPASGPRAAVEAMTTMYEVPRRLVDPPPRASLLT